MKFDLADGGKLSIHRGGILLIEQATDFFLDDRSILNLVTMAGTVHRLADTQTNTDNIKDWEN